MTPTNKNLQDLFKTYVAKSGDEEKFRKAHVISTVDNNDEKLGPKDDQFVATTKTYARDTSHHGYDAGGDEKVYSEEALDEMSSKMKMKLGLYGKKKKMEEEVEELDEISKAMAGRYINKAKNSIDLTAWRQGYKEAGAGSPSKQLEKKLSKRHKGIETAVKKLTSEEAEQNESKEFSEEAKIRYTGGMHGTYEPTKKQSSAAAHLDAAKYHDQEAKSYTAAMNHPNAKKDSTNFYKDSVDYHSGKADYHREAANKLQEEQIDELSVVGLDKYHSKAYQSMFDKDSDKKTVAKRKKGMDTAYNKAGFGKAKVYATEEAELDEATLNPEDERHFEKQTPKMQAAINLHLRKGMDYEDAVAAARRVFNEEVEQTDKLSTAIKKKLSDEGGAAAFKPLKDTAMKMGINLTPEMLKNIPGVSQHDDGDYILKEEVDLDEKKLTKAELKKREEVATAMERENPGMDMGKKMAIATAQAKKVAEEIELGEAVNSDDAFDRLEKAGAKDVKTTSGGIRYTHGGKEYNLRHNMKRTGHRTVRTAELEQHLNRLQEETEVVEEQFAPGKFKEAMIQRGLAALQEHIVGNE